MDSSSEGVYRDLSKYNKLSVEEKRELVYEISKNSYAPETLLSWSRQEILQVLCAEMGKERKYTGLTKLKIIENLLKLVSEKNLGLHKPVTGLEQQQYSSPVPQRTSKRPRKANNPSRLPVPTIKDAVIKCVNDFSNTTCCKNSACRATLRQEDTFCKRCSCCICYQYDDNKDPSLWLVCSSEHSFQEASCGMSCHLECALKHRDSSIDKDKFHAGFDGSFFCAACGRTNDLLRCWRKQLMVGKDTRRVDILSYRLSLCQRLLNGTTRYRKLSEIVDEAVNKLEAEVGPLTGLPVKIGRGIVNRLSSGPEVQKLCDSALELLERMLSDTSLLSCPQSMMQASLSTNLIAPTRIRIEDVHPTSLSVFVCSDDPSPNCIGAYTLWHRKAHDRDYPAKSTCTIFPPNRKFILSGLDPGTEYQFKVVYFNAKAEHSTCEARFSTSNGRDDLHDCSKERSQSPPTNCSSLSNPSSVEDETNNNTPCSDQNDNRADNYLASCKVADKIVPAVLSSGAAKCTTRDHTEEPIDVVSLPYDKHPTDTLDSVPDCNALKFEKKISSQSRIAEELSNDNGYDTQIQTGMEIVPSASRSAANLPITPCRIEMIKDGQARIGGPKGRNKEVGNGAAKGQHPKDSSASKKRTIDRPVGDCRGNDPSDRPFEHYVKVIRCLECEGHIEKNFREKFLTWYSLRATEQEVRIVKTFVDTFMEDPASLAEQLVDTFSECMSSKRSSVVPAGFCMKLWH